MTLDELLAEPTPANFRLFKKWAQECCVEIEKVIDMRKPKRLAEMGQLVFRAKQHLIYLDDAREKLLPIQADKFPLDALARFREVIASKPGDFLTAEQVAAKVQLDIRTIRRQVKSGEFPKPIKFGRSIRWRLSDLNGIW
jgi:predicted DNA-binding transcriptional regulator AlpA